MANLQFFVIDTTTGSPIPASAIGFATETQANTQLATSQVSSANKLVVRVQFDLLYCLPKSFM